MKDLGFGICWTPVYSPIYNGGIENTWSMVKRTYGQIKINSILNNKAFDPEVTIEEAFEL
jgi:hypothetical protein